MHVIKVDLPRTCKELQIDVLSDLHLGCSYCNMDLVKKRLSAIESNPNLFCILNGDLLNMATKGSKSDPYSGMRPSEETNLLIKLLAPIKHKILSAVSGNHESNRIYKETGVDLMALVMTNLGILEKYHPVSNLLFIRFGETSKKETKGTGEYRKVMYSLYHRHYSSGGRKIGGKANSLQDTSSWIDADIIVVGHTHQPLVFKSTKYIIDDKNSCVSTKDILHVNTSATLNFDGSYGENLGFTPNSQEAPIITLCGTRKEATAKL